jgi:AGCS family alanine or glycine:cation symporter
VGVLAMVVWGAYESVATVFNAADASMGLMATVNLIALVLLSGTVVKLTRDYRAQRKAGKVPLFHAADYPELAGKIDQGIWNKHDPG